MSIRLDLDVETFLGKDVYSIVSEPERVDSFLIHQAGKMQERLDFPGHFIIAFGPTLKPEQLQHITGLIRSAGSYYFGKPHCVPQWSFALRLWRRHVSVDLLMSPYHCASWAFYGKEQRKMSFCLPIREELLYLAKSLFPEYASSLPHSVWKQGAIKRLVEQALLKG